MVPAQSGASPPEASVLPATIVLESGKPGAVPKSPPPFAAVLPVTVRFSRHVARSATVASSRGTGMRPAMRCRARARACTLAAVWPRWRSDVRCAARTWAGSPDVGWTSITSTITARYHNATMGGDAVGPGTDTPPCRSSQEAAPSNRQIRAMILARLSGRRSSPRRACAPSSIPATSALSRVRSGVSLTRWPPSLA